MSRRRCCCTWLGADDCTGVFVGGQLLYAVATINGVRTTGCTPPQHCDNLNASHALPFVVASPCTWLAMAGPYCSADYTTLFMAVQQNPLTNKWDRLVLEFSIKSADSPFCYANIRYYFTAILTQQIDVGDTVSMSLSSTVETDDPFNPGCDNYGCDASGASVSLEFF
mgnify:CR=1 FL=1